MNDQEILALVKEALAEVAPDRVEEFEGIDLQATLQDLNLDSVSSMEMVSILEERTDVIFPDEDLARVERLSDLAKLIRGQRVGA